jgi:N-acetyl-alpha-D-glucosaminyl L-malate synthase BshA
MNIGIVCYPTFGGSGVVATELGKALADKGHKIHFITYSQPFRLDTFSENIFYHEVNIKSYALFDYDLYEQNLISTIVNVALYEKLDILHVHYAIPHASAAFMAREILKKLGSKLPYITTLHGTDITLVGRDPAYKPVITFSITESDAVTTVSESLKNDTKKYFGIRKNIDVIPNFIRLYDYTRSETNCPKNLYAPNGEKLLIHISNFRKVKRVEDVLRVFNIVRKHIPAKLILVGDGPERANIEQLCRELDTCGDIHRLGKINNPEQVLCVCDLFILPSETESFGLSALEAMAAGVPVISSNAGGLPEVNINGITGYLSNVGDVENMAQNALSIIKDEKTLIKFKHNAKEQAKKFDLEKILPLYEALYNKVLNKYA